LFQHRQHCISFPSEDLLNCKRITKGHPTAGELERSRGQHDGNILHQQPSRLIVGYPGYTKRTTNGGTFMPQDSGVQDRLNDVFFINPDTAG
jgi:hypothetical protein